MKITSRTLLALILSFTALHLAAEIIKFARGMAVKGITVGAQTAATSTTFVSDLTWTSMTNGWGPVELDKSNGNNAAGDGATITIRSATFLKGLGTNAISNVQYDLSALGSCSSFQATVGVDDEALGLGTVTFEVWGDASMLYQSAVLNGVSTAAPINVNITGHTLLQLIVNDGGDGNASDHADWANARVTCSGSAPPPPPPPLTTEVIIPTNAGVYNVKTGYGAAGDGVTDDTAAIRSAMLAIFAVGSPAVLYFPTGTYLVSDRLTWRDNSNNWHSNCSFQGQNESNTIIKLKDSSTGYGSSASPKAVIYTGSNENTTLDGSGGSGYNNHMWNFTLDTGSGNPGAIGIDWNANNVATVRHVTIRAGDGTGFIGLDLRRSFFGPALVKYVTITGFDTGIYNSETGVSTTFEHITLSGQHSSGFHNSGDGVTIRDLKSTNTVPAVTADYFTGMTVIIDSQLNGGSGSAIINSGNSKLFARNISTTGYSAAIQGVSGTSVTEYTSEAAHTLFDSPPLTSLNLPIAEFPEYYDTDLTHWANVVSYGANGTDSNDDAAAIQAAIDSGQTTVYFPRGGYFIASTIHIRGNVRHIIGFGASISAIGSPNPAFRVESANNDILIERLNFGNGFGSTVIDASTKTVAIRDLWNLQYSNTAGAGQLFLDNTAFGGYAFTGQTAWVRQLNPEGGDPKVINNAGTLWVLDLKTEPGGLTPGTEITTTNGGRTELLGGYFSILSGGNSFPAPAFIVTESQFSGTYTSGGSGGDHAVTVRQTKGGVTRNLNDLLNRVGVATGMTLFTGTQ